MITVCPHRNLSYATWRLKVLAELCSSSSLTRPTGRVCSNDINLKIGNAQSRQFHASVTQLSRRKSQAVHSKKKNDKGSKKKSDNRTQPAQTSQQPSNSGPNKSAVRRRLVRRLKSFYVHRIPLAFGIDAPLAIRKVTKGAELPLRNFSRKWNPRTKEGRNDLKSMIAELEAMTKESLGSPENQATKSQPMSSGKYFNIPESPIHYTKRLLLNEKRTPRYEDMDQRLIKNPWANMLAGPLRQCNATKARLPWDLMTTWGVIQNPINQQAYMMPIELSDLQAFSSKMVVNFDSPNGALKVNRTAGTEGERIHVQPNKLLLQAVSDQVIKVDAGISSKHTNSGILGTYFVPYRWRTKLEMANAFRRTQKTSDPKTGEMLPASQDWKKDVPTLTGLHWQENIAERMQNMMNQRVMIAIGGVANSNATSKGIRARRIFALDVPKTGFLRLDKNGLQADDDNAAQQTSVNTEGPILNDTVPANTISQHDTSLSASSPMTEEMMPDWLHGSIFLHLGTPQEYVERTEQWHTIQSSNAPGPFNRSLLPPTISINGATRLPVFNLATLLGPKSVDQIKALKSDYGLLDFRFWESYLRDKQEYLAAKAEANSSAADSSKNEFDPAEITQSFKQYYEEYNPNAAGEHAKNREYLILIKNTAHKSTELIRELWQLWRFIGGRKGLWLDGVGNERKNNFHWCYPVSHVPNLEENHTDSHQEKT